MEAIRNRSRELLPQVLLTLVSMVQALALELFWTRLQGSGYLWEPGWTAAIGWLQFATLLLGLLQVWLFYTSMALRFRWTPTVRDALLPFGIGLLEFLLVSVTGPESYGIWFAVLGAIFAVSVWEGKAISERARRDPENREFFEMYAPAGLRDYVPSIVSIGVLFLLGIILGVTGNKGWLVLIGMLGAAGAILYQIESVRGFWNRSIEDAG